MEEAGRPWESLNRAFLVAVETVFLSGEITSVVGISLMFRSIPDIQEDMASNM